MDGWTWPSEAPDSDVGIFLNTCGQPPANLSVDISDSPDPVANGAQVTYTIDLQNSGPNTATGVLVAQVLPAGLDFISAASSQGSCSLFALATNVINSTVGCPLGSLPSGGSALITVTARAVAGGTRTSSVAVTSNEFDPASADNSAFETTSVNAGAVTLTVVNTNNEGGSLRQAIVDANVNAGQLDTIAFNIGTGGTQTITLSTPLPNLTDSVVIDGTTQRIQRRADRRVERKRPGHERPDARAGSNLSTIRGLVINRFGGAGISVAAASSGNVIERNFIGLDTTGTQARPNAGAGVRINSANNRVGGTASAQRNVISGNQGTGCSSPARVRQATWFRATTSALT